MPNTEPATNHYSSKKCLFYVPWLQFVFVFLMLLIAVLVLGPSIVPQALFRDS